MDPGERHPVTSRRARVRHWVVQRPVRQWWKAGVATVLAVAALFGGLDTVNTGAVPFAAGDDFSDGQYTATVHRATLLPTVTGGGRTIGPVQPGKLYLGVTVTLTNDGTVPGRLPDELDLRDVEGKQFFGVWRVRDGSQIQTLGPGLTEELAYLWVVPQHAVTPGGTVSVRIWKKQFKQLMVAYGGKEWLDSLTDYGVVDLTVEEPA
ncbi:DUF4352 domain-containing protein [Mycolicibacterium sp. 018/SC-01/001]|uniref:DUF4352 domain-containing protein n=1 Tax=Mycolicibacterium sp. 018/SC-01/001 TaxID=2592069 RepID=UPI0011808317|nr:DUF4352 domain-containing protein [Mycolicibacterium sp. 018/SC-01/001]TRW83364.1 DUF4352 domain-containing protein [Mycolicibacterium sp. 018/SC-01/001]